MPQSTELNINRLRWHCRRGMRELDVLLMKYFDQRFPKLDAQAQQVFAEFLDIPDPDIYAFLTGRQVPEDVRFVALVSELQQTHQ